MIWYLCFLHTKNNAMSKVLFAFHHAYVYNDTTALNLLISRHAEPHPSLYQPNLHSSQHYPNYAHSLFRAYSVQVRCTDVNVTRNSRRWPGFTYTSVRRGFADLPMIIPLKITTPAMPLGFREIESALRSLGRWMVTLKTHVHE